jgi:hypothetical protein
MSKFDKLAMALARAAGDQKLADLRERSTGNVALPLVTLLHLVQFARIGILHASEKAWPETKAQCRAGRRKLTQELADRLGKELPEVIQAVATFTANLADDVDDFRQRMKGDL